MPIGEQNTKILPNKAPIMVTWVPRETGATLPDGKNSDLNYVDILIKHKQENNEKRDMMLFLNDPQNRTNPEFMPGFLPDQINDLKNKFKGVNGIHIVNLHDPKYDLYWKEIDQGWQINGKPISIKEYYRNMYSMKPEDRAPLSVEVDTFRYIAAYFVLREQAKLEQDQGVIYTDFDALDRIGSSEYKEKLRGELYIKKRGTEQKGIGQDIMIPYGILAPIVKFKNKFKHDPSRTELVTRANNDVFAITDCSILQKIFSHYKEEINNRSEVFECLSKHGRTKANVHVPFSNDALNDLIRKNHGSFISFCNIAQQMFIYVFNEVRNTIVNSQYVGDSFDFSKNGGEYLCQTIKIASRTSNDVSWLKDIYNKKEEKNEQVSEQQAEPSTLIGSKIDTKSSIFPNACSI